MRNIEKFKDRVVNIIEEDFGIYYEDGKPKIFLNGEGDLSQVL